MEQGVVIIIIMIRGDHANQVMLGYRYRRPNISIMTFDKTSFLPCRWGPVRNNFRSGYPFCSVSNCGCSQASQCDSQSTFAASSFILKRNNPLATQPWILPHYYRQGNFFFFFPPWEGVCYFWGEKHNILWVNIIHKITTKMWKQLLQYSN